MCGIAGMMMKGGAEADPALLRTLAAAIHHRGPDSTDIWTGGAVGLLSERLAIMDVEGGDQPLFGPNGCVLVANGEIYNNPELRAELAGHSFRTGSDCEPAAHLYEKHGIGYANCLRGMFAIAIWDPAEQRLLVTRDPFGIKPLYYIEHERGFYFASEAQALIAAGLTLAEIDPRHRDELLQLKYTVGRQTVFKGIQRVLPGETLVVRDGAIAERLRHPALPAPVQRAQPDEAVAAFDKVMIDSVGHHLHTDVPYGLFLSGGIDSSILLLLMQRLSSTQIRAITAGYARDPAMDESRAALAFAERHGADCRRVEMSEADFFRYAPRIAAAIDDPTCDAAVLPTWMLGKAAREDGLKVTLCGEGADELFAGYRRYRPNLMQRLRGGKVRRGVFEKSGVDLGGGWKDGMEAVRDEMRSTWVGMTMRRQAADIAEWLPNDLLNKLDRCLMIHSVEGRTPYLDREVGKFAVTLPESLKSQGDLGKIVMRRWLAKADPKYPAMAKKKGFNTPVGGWIAARAATIAPLLAQQPGVREVFDADTVQRLIAGAAERDQPAWSLLYYGLWHSTRVLGIAPDGDVDAVLQEAAA